MTSKPKNKRPAKAKKKPPVRKRKPKPLAGSHRIIRADPAPNSQGGDGDRNLSSWDAGR